MRQGKQILHVQRYLQIQVFFTDTLKTHAFVCMHMYAHMHPPWMAEWKKKVGRLLEHAGESKESGEYGPGT